MNPHSPALAMDGPQQHVQPHTTNSRVDIGLLLNPVNPSGTPRLSDTILLSIESFDSPARKVTSPQVQIHQAPRCQRQGRSQDCSSTYLPPTPESLPSEGSYSTQDEGIKYVRIHNNTRYTQEQIHYIRYMREDKNKSWETIVTSFNSQFPAMHRNKGGLESRYYRAQVYPVLDQFKNHIIGENGVIETRKVTIRQRLANVAQISSNITLVDSCPDEVLLYSWTDVADKERARKIIEECSSKSNTV